MTNSKTYRSQKVQSVQVEAMLAGREGQPAVVGVDVGKKELFLAVRWPDGHTERPVVVAQPEELPAAMVLLGRLSEGRKVRVVVEPSGTYVDAFRYACHRAGQAVERVSTVASKRHAEVYDGVPSQHDGKDAGVIAELGALGKSAPWAWSSGRPEDSLLAAHAALLDDAQQEVSQWRGRLEGKLARHWPEVGTLLALDSTTLLRALIHYGSPQSLAQDGRSGARLAQWGGPLLQADKITLVVQSARKTAGAAPDSGEVYHIQEIARNLLASRRRLEHHHRALSEAAEKLPAVQVAGGELGVATMAIMHVEAGNPAEYPHGGAYVRALGLNLTERSSGAYQGQMHISKRGSPVARRWLYLAALRVVQKPGIREWYEAKVGRDGGQKGKAVVGVMRKLALGIQHCCRTGEAFELGKVFQDRAARPGRRPRRRARRRARARAIAEREAAAPVVGGGQT